jgi:hypothetical protein
MLSLVLFHDCCEFNVMYTMGLEAGLDHGDAVLVHLGECVPFSVSAGWTSAWRDWTAAGRGI